MNPYTKEKQIHRHRKQIYGDQKEREEMKGTLGVQD